MVTGAGGMRGIGRAIALRLARDGFDVAVLDIERPDAEKPEDEVKGNWKGVESVRAEVVALGRRSVAIHADITSAADVQKAVERTTAELGRLDVLVNNARAILGHDRVPVVDLEPSEWDRVMGVNARGTFLCSQAAARQMIRQHTPGHIVNISSASGKEGKAGQAAYCASKFAINASPSAARRSPSAGSGRRMTWRTWSRF
jgi:3-oxoacyl-[acyl-carrier protein] reductase